MANPKVKVVTPKGELQWVNITGQGKENYNEDGYNYVASIRLSGDAAESLKSKIDEVLGETKGKTVKSLGYSKVYKDDKGFFVPTSSAASKERMAEDPEETEFTEFRFTTTTTWDDGKPKKVDVFNSKAQKVNLGDKLIGNGSIGCISGLMQKFEKGKDTGVSLFLNAVQIIDMVEYGGDAGFEEQEGDFTGADEEASEAGFTTEDTAKEQAPKKARPKL